MDKVTKTIKLTINVWVKTIHDKADIVKGLKVELPIMYDFNPTDESEIMEVKIEGEPV